MANGIGYKMSKRKETATLFTVIGDGEFPLDMLRYDGCYPQHETDTTKMSESGLREVTLHKTLNWAHPKVWSPTVGRWNSFGWAVLGELPRWRFTEGALTHNTLLADRLQRAAPSGAPSTAHMDRKYFERTRNAYEQEPIVRSFRVRERQRCVRERQQGLGDIAAAYAAARRGVASAVGR